MADHAEKVASMHAEAHEKVKMEKAKLAAHKDVEVQQDVADVYDRICCHYCSATNIKDLTPEERSQAQPIMRALRGLDPTWLSDDNINLELLDVDHSNTISSTEWKTFLKNAYLPTCHAEAFALTFLVWQVRGAAAEDAAHGEQAAADGRGPADGAAAAARTRCVYHAPLCRIHVCLRRADVVTGALHIYPRNVVTGAPAGGRAGRREARVRQAHPAGRRGRPGQWRLRSLWRSGSPDACLLLLPARTRLGRSCF